MITDDIIASLTALRWDFKYEIIERISGKGMIFTADLTDHKGRWILFRFYEFGKTFNELFSLFEQKAKLAGLTYCFLHFPSLKRNHEQIPFMQVVAPRDHDATNGYSYVIQNCYKVRQIVPAALPRPVYIDIVPQMLLEAGVRETIDDPSSWSTVCDFDAKAYFADYLFQPPQMLASFRPPGILKPKALLLTSPSFSTPRKYSSPPASASASAFGSLASSAASSPPSHNKAPLSGTGKGSTGFSEQDDEDEIQESNKRAKGYSEEDFDADDSPSKDKDAVDTYQYSDNRIPSPDLLPIKKQRAPKRSSNLPLKLKKQTIIEIL